MVFSPTDSPLRSMKRGITSRGGAGPTARLSTASAIARYSLYAALLVVGYMAGSWLRAPGPFTVPHQQQLSSSSTTPTTSGSARDATRLVHHRSAKLETLTEADESGTLANASEQDRSAAALASKQQRQQQHNAQAGAAAAAVAAEASRLQPANYTLRFQVCNGFANQRLGIIYGMLLAKHLGRTAVLPVLVDNGLQRSDESVLANGDNQVPFATVYDAPYFTRSMAAAGVRVMTPEAAPPSTSYMHVPLAPYGWSVAGPLGAQHGGAAHLAVDCVLFKMMPGDLAAEDTQLIWAGLAALRPSREAADILDRIATAIPRLGAAAAARAAKAAAASIATSTAAQQQTAGDTSHLGAVARPMAANDFNFVHLRIENDWLAHCKRWESINDGLVRDNCFSYTDDIGARLALFGLPNTTALYVGSYWDDVDSERRRKALAQLAASGYAVVTSEDVFPKYLASRAMQDRRSLAGTGGVSGATAGGSFGREYRAMLEYFLGLRATRFIGNSVSTFAALALLERRHVGRWAAYYNGGNIPLSTMLPALHRLPWVFTYNSWSPSYEYLLKAAVRSAVSHGSLLPYCIFQGDPASPIASWLTRHGVTLISHTPAWREQLLVKARSKAKENVHHSHLFKTPDMLVSTFQRVDLPVVPLLDQYTYVLYTDADVYFRKPVRLDDFGLPLPRTVSMSYEFVNTFPYNAGVMVANLPAMRLNYQPFIAMMLDNDNGLYYTNYGPADQGIMNKYYEVDLKARLLSQGFNAKPYNAFDPAAFIVHFHGPKPHDLISYLATGKCDFFTICETSFENAVCQYAREWVEWVPDQLEALRLEDACGWLENSNVAEVFKRKWGLAGSLQGAAAGAVLPEEQQRAVAQADHFRAAASSPPLVARADPKQADERERTLVTRMRRALLQQQPEQEQESQQGQAAQQLSVESAVQSGSQEQGGQTQGAGPQQHQQQLQGGLAKEPLLRGGVTNQEEHGVRGAGRNGQGVAQGAIGQAGGADAGASAGGGAPKAGGGDEGVTLKDFDTFKALTADEAALDAAWGIGEARGDGAGGAASSGAGRQGEAVGTSRRRG